MRLEPWEGLCLAPAFGLALQTSLAVALAMLGVALTAWAWPLTMVLIALSLAAAYRARHARLAGRGTIWVPVSGLLVAFALLMGPSLLGRLKFMLSSAAFGDSIFFSSLAKAMRSPGLGILQGASIQALVNVRPELAIARINLSDRWGAPALLGWQSSLSGSTELCLLPFLYLEALLLCYPVGYAWLRRCGASRLWAALAAAATVAGFWAILALDISAFGHLAALPVLLALGLLAASQAEGPTTVSWLTWAVMGLLLHALVLLYVELAVFGALVLPLMGLFVERRYRPRWFTGLAFALLLSLAINPWGAWHHLAFLGQQWRANQPGVPDVHAYLYDWIKGASAWARIGRCVWGYWPSGSMQAGASFLRSLGDGIGIAALLPLAGVLVWAVRARRQPALALALFAATGLALGLGGLLVGSQGAAGKCFHYTGFFSLLLLGLVPQAFHGFPRFGRLFALLAIGMFLGQLSQTLVRARLAASRDFRPQPYPDLYEPGIGTTLSGDELQPLREALKGHERELLLVDVRGAIRDYIFESLGPQRFCTLEPLGEGGRTWLAEGDESPAWLLLAKGDYPPSALACLPMPDAAGGQFALFRLGPGRLAQMARCLSQPSGAWTRSRVLNPGLVLQRFIASGSEAYRLRMTGTGSPPLELGFNGRWRRMPLRQGQSIYLTPKPGINELLVRFKGPVVPLELLPVGVR
jgi:hypothetical protein